MKKSRKSDIYDNDLYEVNFCTANRRWIKKEIV